MFELCQETCGPNRLGIVLMGEAGANLQQVVSEEAIAAACGYRRGKASLCLLDAIEDADDFVAGQDLVLLAGNLSIEDDLLARALQMVQSCARQQVRCCLLPDSTVIGLAENGVASQLVSAVDHVLLLHSDWLQFPDQQGRMCEALKDLAYAALGEGLLLTSLQDLFVVLDSNKYGCYTCAVASGENRAVDAASAAISVWPRDANVRAVLCSIRSGYEISFAEIQAILEKLNEKLPADCFIFTSSTCIEPMHSEVHIGLTGFMWHKLSDAVQAML